jgi:O-antigen/teichoic acid export membrane protein
MIARLGIRRRPVAAMTPTAVCSENVDGSEPGGHGPEEFPTRPGHSVHRGGPTVVNSRLHAGSAALWVAASNIAFNLIGLLTGPILARALGPAGRGTLAAIVVPLTVGGMVASLGMPEFALRSAAREGRALTLSVTLAVISLVIAVIMLPLAPILASALAEDREVVHTYLMVGFVLLPLFVMSYVMYSVVTGLERWGLLVTTRLAPSLLGLIALAALWATDQLTVATAAAVVLTTTLLVLVPAAFALRDGGAFSFDRELAGRALRFSARAWPGYLGQYANARLDQLLMIPLVDPADLGLYVVAVTLSSIPAVLASALAATLGPRTARGETDLVAKGHRVLLPLVAVMSVAMAAAAPVGVPLVFGHDFASAVPIAWILLAASVPYQGAWFLGATLTAAGRPGLFTAGHIVALVVTVPGLLLLLPPLGAYGAAIVSSVSAVSQFAFLLVMVRREFGGSLWDYVVPKPVDRKLIRLSRA